RGGADAAGVGEPVPRGIERERERERERGMATAAEGDRRPFPRRSVVILSLVLTINTYTLANLFPYVGMMAKHIMGLSTTNESGFYAGYIASSFTFGRFLTAYVWGKAADKVGRKPVVMIGLSSIVACSVAFGLSNSFAMAVASRFILGLTNGIMAAVRTMTQEVCGPEHVVIGTTYVLGSKGAGLVIGTAIGGLLALPALNYPTVFSSTGVFAEYPFLLPNLFGAALALLVLPLVYFYLPETRPRLQPLALPLPRSGGESPNLRTPVVGSRYRRGKGGRRQTVYQSLNDDADIGMAQQEQQQQQQQGSAGVVPPIITTNGTGKSREKKKKKKEENAQTTRRYELLDGAEDGSGNGNGNGSNNQRGRNVQAAVRVNDGRSSNDSTSSDTCSISPTSGPGSDGGGGGDSGGGGGDSGGGGGETRLCGPHGLLSAPNVKTLLFMVTLVQAASIGYDEAYPLWALSTVDVGGMGWSTKQIGKVFGATGVTLVVFQLFVYPRVIRRVGVVTWQRAGGLLGVPFFVAVPYARSLSWNERSLFVVSVANNVLAVSSIGSVMLALTVASTSIVPSRQRGAFGGLFMTAESLGRFMGPAGFSNMYAWSISPPARGWVDRRFVFFLAAAIMALVSALAWRTFSSLDEQTKSSSEPAQRRG
ncbi:unnamed protein product, partial [Pylaiella littoralis]